MAARWSGSSSGNGPEAEPAAWVCAWTRGCSVGTSTLGLPCQLPCPSGGPESPVQPELPPQGQQVPSCSLPRGRWSHTWAGQRLPPHRPPWPHRLHPWPREQIGPPSSGPGSSSTWWGSTGRSLVQPHQQPRDSLSEHSRMCPWLRGPQNMHQVPASPGQAGPAGS